MAVPEAPVGARCDQTGDHLSIYWQDAEDNITETLESDGSYTVTSVTEQFRIEESADGETGWSETATIDWPNIFYADTGQTSGQLYYRVYAVNGDGDSDSASDVVDNTPITAPTAPDTLAVTAHPLGPLLSWSLNSTTEDAVVVVRDAGDVVTLAPGTEQYIDTGADLGTEYTWAVRVENDAGTNTSSNLVDTAGTGAAQAQPTGLSAARSGANVALSWTDASSGGGDNYEVSRSDDSGNSWTVLDATLAADATSYTDSTGTADEEYLYRVRVLETGNASSLYSDPVRFRYVGSLLDGPPNAPYDLSLTVDSATQITAAWLDCSGDEIGFRLYRSTDNFQTEEEVSTVGANVLTLTNTGLTPSTTYYYEVVAYNNEGESARSNRVNATTSAAGSAPSAPSDLQLGAREFTALTFNWTDNANNETFFEIELTVVQSGTSAIGRLTQTNLESLRIAPLTTGTLFAVRVRAGNENGVSSWSNRASGLTLGIGNNPPTAPQDLQVTTASWSQLDLTWNNPNQDAERYIIQRGLSLGTLENIHENVQPAFAVQQSWSDTGLAPDTEYYYRVVAWNRNGIARSTIVAGRTARNYPQAPSAPTLNAVTQIRGFAARVDYTSNDTSADGFYIKRKTGAGAYSTIQTEPPLANGETTVWIDDTIAEGNTYTYKMTAFRGGLESADSDEVEFVATAPVSNPTAPSNCVAVALAADLVLVSWRDNSSNETQFEIERSTTGGGVGFSAIANSPVGAGVTEVYDDSVSASTTYYYRVRATNGNGSSAYTDEAEVTTGTEVAAAPTGPTITTSTVLGPSSIRVDWNQATGDFYNYVVKRSTDGSSYSTVATISPSRRSYPDVGLSASTKYWHRIDALGPGGTGPGSQTPSNTTLANSGGTGEQPGRGHYQRYQREFDVNDDPVTVFTAADGEGAWEVLLCYIQTGDTTNGPFTTVSIGGTVMAKYPASAGLDSIHLEKFIVPEGNALVLTFSGSGSAIGRYVVQAKRR